MGEESEAQRLILEYLSQKQVWCRRYANRVTRIGGRLFVPIRLPSGKPDNGHPDIMARTESGTLMWIECKSSTGKLSEDQEKWKRDADKWGDIFIVARSVEDVADLYEGRNY